MPSDEAKGHFKASDLILKSHATSLLSKTPIKVTFKTVVKRQDMNRSSLMRSDNNESMISSAAGDSSDGSDYLKVVSPERFKWNSLKDKLKNIRGKKRRTGSTGSGGDGRTSPDAEQFKRI